MILEENREYRREDNIIYRDNIAFIKLHQDFINISSFSKTVFDYMNRYLERFPQLFTYIESKMKIIKFFYGLETTGTNVKIHGIHQISGCIEVNDEVVEHFDFKVRPNPKAKIEPEALSHSGVTEEIIMEYPEMKSVHKKIVALLGKYVDRYNPKEKIYLVGFNNRKFDDIFFRAWFEQNGDDFFGSWFWGESLDVMVQACEYLINRRLAMPSFKLKRVALELGLDVDETRLHDAVYDISLTRDIYRIVTFREIEV